MIPKRLRRPLGSRDRLGFVTVVTQFDVYRNNRHPVVMDVTGRLQ